MAQVTRGGGGGGLERLRSLGEGGGPLGGLLCLGFGGEGEDRFLDGREEPERGREVRLEEGARGGCEAALLFLLLLLLFRGCCSCCGVRRRGS